MSTPTSGVGRLVAHLKSAAKRRTLNISFFVILFVASMTACGQSPSDLVQRGSPPMSTVGCPQDNASADVQPAGDRAARRWWRRSGASRAPVLEGSPVVPEPLGGVLSVQIDAVCEPACDPVLFELFVRELHAAVNATADFRTLPLEPPVLARPSVSTPELSGPDLPGTTSFVLQEPLIAEADAILSVAVRSISPYRPMAVDAALELRHAELGSVIARFDDVWQAPVDSVVLRTTRQGWLKRNWKPTPTMSEAAALEASSPRTFVTGLAARLAESLAEAVDPADVLTGSDWSTPAALRPLP